MRTRNLLLVVTLIFGTSAHAAWQDWVPRFFRGNSNPTSRTEVEQPPPITPSGSVVSSRPGRFRANSIYDLADREALFAAKKRIIQAVTEAMSKPVEVRPQYDATIVQSMNDAFFALYDELDDLPALPSEKDRTTSSDQREKYRQLEHLFARYDLVPPEIAGSWAMAKATLDTWYRSGMKQPKVAKPTPSPMSWLVHSDSGLRNQAIDAFTKALDAEIVTSDGINYKIALLALFGNSSEYYSDGGTYPEDTVSDRLMGANEWSNFVSVSASVALTRLALINTVEAWNQFVLAFTGGNTSMPAPYYGLHFFMTELFLQSATPEKTQALTNAAALIKDAEIKASHHDRELAIGLVTKLKEPYAELTAAAATNVCAVALGAQAESARKSGQQQ